MRPSNGTLLSPLAVLGSTNAPYATPFGNPVNVAAWTLADVAITRAVRVLSALTNTARYPVTAGVAVTAGQVSVTLLVVGAVAVGSFTGSGTYRRGPSWS